MSDFIFGNDYAGDENIYLFSFTPDDFQYFVVAADSTLTEAVNSLKNSFHSGIK